MRPVNNPSYTDDDNLEFESQEIGEETPMLKENTCMTQEPVSK